MSTLHVHRLAAFSDSPEGGNPAGVVLTDEPLDDATMQGIAAEVGFSETAFCVPTSSDRRRWDVRYFAPTVEVPFCGHATIATGVLLGRTVGEGEYHLATRGGEVRVHVDRWADGRPRATLTSVAPRVEAAPEELLADVLGTLSVDRGDLDPRLPPALADAGASHLVLVVAARQALASLTYDFEALRVAMEEAQITTVAVLWQERGDRYHARNLFPVGGVVEDPATGAAAAAFGAYLRARGLLEVPGAFEILQGADMGRPSRLLVTVPAGPDTGIEVTGTAVDIL
jgi:PhzF family phenazine biosynthesis protein